MTEILDDVAAREAARLDYLADPSLTGSELAAKYGRSDRWGRRRIAETRQTGTDMTDSGQRTVNGQRTAVRIVPVRTADTITDTAADCGQRTADSVADIAADSGQRTADSVADIAADTRADNGQRTADSVTDTAADGGQPDSALSATDGQRTAPPSMGLVVVATAAVVMVTVVTAVVSYVHIRDLARVAGEDRLADLLPLGIDGLVVACTASIILDRRRGTSGHVLAWTGVALGLVGSVAANVLAVVPELVNETVVAAVLAGYPPVALAIAAHLLFRMHGGR